MRHWIITRWDHAGRIIKCRPCADLSEAEVALRGIAETWPEAFIVAEPEAGARFDWYLADPVTGTVTLSKPPEPTAAERAAGLVLDSSDFYLALVASPLIDWSGRIATETPRAWLVRTILASGLDPSTRLAGASIAETASLFHRADPQRPGLMEAVAAILPRADAQPGGLTSAEIDALFLAAAG